MHAGALDHQGVRIGIALEAGEHTDERDMPGVPHRSDRARQDSGPPTSIT
jgi:hypothetical protein